ncbi:hypothetical protein [Methanosarcina horonobensis]|uniref:hypothetical protein n=1 Tax=Methanosarcina horonobensis TaxID=418008 RepID=UPI000B1CF333|nr:hypothetical protein [Methanosarcina horonobensis]
MLNSMFLDREEYIESFKSNLKNIDKNSCKVLFYYGISGVGKTALMKKLSTVIEEYNSLQHSIEILWEEMNLATTPMEIDTFLFALRDKLSRKYKIGFPFFDIVHAIYFKKAYPDKRLKNENYFFYDENSIMGGIKAINLIETLDTISQRKFQRELTNYFANFSLQFNHLQNKHIEELSKLPYKEVDEIKKSLPFYWALDFCEHLLRNSKPAVIFLDTYEALRINSIKKSRFYISEDWLREFISSTPYTIWVICGRDELNWKEFDARFKCIIEKYKLTGLSEIYSRKLLSHYQIESKEIQDKILDISDGIPGYLSISIDSYDEIIRTENRLPTIRDISKASPLNIENILQYLTPSEIELIEILSIPRYWDYDLAKSLTDEFNISYRLEDFPTLCNFSFVIEKTKDKWFIQQTIRDSLLDYIGVNVKREVNAFFT